MLLPVDLRDWIPENDLVHFVIGAVDTMNLSAVSVNSRGSGSKQYPPRMMLALLIYCYCNGVFASRRIERATYRDVAVRYLSGDTHPDHDTICTFRRENGKAVKEAFAEVLRLGRQMGLLKVGMVSVDGTHMKANASKHKSVRYDRAGELEEQLRKDIEALLQRAEKADEEPAEDGQKLPQEIARREALLEKMRWAREELEKRAKDEADKQDDKDKGQGPKSGGENPAEKPKESQQRLAPCSWGPFCPILSRLLVSFLCPLQQRLYVLAQLLFQFPCPIIAHTLVIGGVRFHVGPVNADHPDLQQPHLTPQAENLSECFLYCLSILSTKCADGVVIGMGVPAQVANRYVTIGRSLDSPRGEDSVAVAIDQQRQHHSGWILLAAAAAAVHRDCERFIVSTAPITKCTNRSQVSNPSSPQEEASASPDPRSPDAQPCLQFTMPGGFPEYPRARIFPKSDRLLI